MECKALTVGDPLWEKTIAFAGHCSWKAGPYLARQMTENHFQDWERVIVAVDQGRIAGFCTFTEKDELPDTYPYAPFIGFVFVDENFRGKRLSGQMIDCAIQYARELGFQTVYLMSGEHGLYEKYGFEKIGDFETVFGTVDQLFQKTI